MRETIKTILTEKYNTMRQKIRHIESRIIEIVGSDLEEFKLRRDDRDSI